MSDSNLVQLVDGGVSNEELMHSCSNFLLPHLFFDAEKV